ncbi:M48 family metallopeptidase [Natrinema salsiterrestre]|uniref:M48 family metalloprotease n=1 Tax=Natrinema salsiterrestre TaxID=2950540 RepID=A0A9Q4L6N7_9EURY|nr:M48 family metalloprotease [Natrinema salsiterrestre]MDF9746261.1 M48 family metalloprotease [Natrinema salsiterrestre]
MRFTTPAGLTLRAALAASISGAVLAGSLTVVLIIAVVGGMIITAYASDLLGYVPIHPPRHVWPIFWSLCGLVALGWFTRAIERAVRAERRALLERAVPPSEVAVVETSHLDSAVDRLARQVGIPVPELRVDPTATPLAYTTYRPTDPIVRVGRDDTPVIVISRGLIETLPQSELVAVLAHEIGHIANDDLRLMTLVLVPFVAAETLTEDEGATTNVSEICGHLLSFVASIGVSVFSRGRELAADRAAVTLTGDPGALAAALERLDGAEPTKPTADLREHTRSANAINVLPTLGPAKTVAGVRSTHPPLETRLEQLRSLATD